MKVSIIGLGLIGGSIAKTLKKNAKGHVICAYDSPSVLNSAITENTIDIALLTPEESLESDIIFLCLPLQLSLDMFEKLAPRLKPGTILTDVCGVKGIFQDKWNGMNSDGIYIGGHPMAGKEKGGYENSDPLLFENAVYILTSQPQDNLTSRNFFELISHLGARISYLDPYTHDCIVSSVSHIPQLLSVALVNSASKCCTDTDALTFAAGGFRDMTRIASSNFNIWEDVIKYNRTEILKSLDLLDNEIKHIRNFVMDDNSAKLENMFISASEKRSSIPLTNKGFLSPLYDIFVFIKDIPGIISNISTALFNENINIKDIELLKIREGSGGNFRLSFESEEEMMKAREVLSSAGITVNN